MSRFFSNTHDTLKAYTPGEQPQDKKYIKLNSNESPFPPSPFSQRLSREVCGELQLYSDPTCNNLVKVASEVFNLKDDQILFTNGSDEALAFIFLAFCDKENSVVFPDITYGFYPVFANLFNIPYEEIKLDDDFKININDYKNIGKNIFIANPNAQTGIALKVEEIEEIVKSNMDNIVVIDEAYVDFGNNSSISLIDKYDNIIVTQTLSKSRSLAGARLGVVFSNSDIIKDLNTIKYSFNPYNINKITMNAGIGALIDKEYFENNCNTIISNREYLKAELRKMNFTVTDSTSNFVLAKSDKKDGESLYKELKEKGILVRHFDNERIKDYIRITIGTKEQLDILITALEEIL